MLASLLRSSKRSLVKFDAFAMHYIHTYIYRCIWVMHTQLTIQLPSYLACYTPTNVVVVSTEDPLLYAIARHHATCTSLTSFAELIIAHFYCQFGFCAFVLLAEDDNINQTAVLAAAILNAALFKSL